jgi:hypothetical protein
MRTLQPAHGEVHPAERAARVSPSVPYMRSRAGGIKNADIQDPDSIRGATIRGPGNLPSPALGAGREGHRTSPLGTARAYFPGVLGGQQLRSPTGWFSELILPDYRSAAAAGRRVINSSGSGPGTRSIADSGAVRQDLRSKINRATTSNVQAINELHSVRSVPAPGGQRPWMLTALSVACAMRVSSTLPPVRLNNQVPEGDQHRRRDIRQPKVKLRHETSGNASPLSGIRGEPLTPTVTTSIAGEARRSRASRAPLPKAPRSD